MYSLAENNFLVGAMDLSTRFPFLEEKERAIIASFEQGNAPQADVVQLMLGLSEDFKAASSTLERVKFRSKLISLAGLYEIIPVAKFEAAKNAPLGLNFLELIIDEGQDPLEALIHCGEVPFDLLGFIPLKSNITCFKVNIEKSTFIFFDFI